jgi:hypothetical protein
LHAVEPQAQRQEQERQADAGDLDAQRAVAAKAPTQAQRERLLVGDGAERPWHALSLSSRLTDRATVRREQIAKRSLLDA